MGQKNGPTFKVECLRFLFLVLKNNVWQLRSTIAFGHYRFCSILKSSDSCKICFVATLLLILDFWGNVADPINCFYMWLAWHSWVNLVSVESDIFGSLFAYTWFNRTVFEISIKISIYNNMPYGKFFYLTKYLHEVGFLSEARLQSPIIHILHQTTWLEIAKCFLLAANCSKLFHQCVSIFSQNLYKMFNTDKITRQHNRSRQAMSDL